MESDSSTYLSAPLPYQLDNMRFNLVPFAILVACAVAVPLSFEKRDLAIFERNTKLVETALNTLMKALRGEKPSRDPIDQQNYVYWLLDMDTKLQTELRVSAQEIRQAPTFADSEMFKVIPIMQTIIQEYSTTLTGWSAIKSIVQSAGMKPAVQDQLIRHSAYLSTFLDAGTYSQINHRCARKLIERCLSDQQT
jgi:hypothetical protein